MGTTTLARNTDLTPEQATRRRALIDAALTDPDATWTLDDICLVADAEEQTVKVWAIRYRRDKHPHFPQPVGTYRKQGPPGKSGKPRKGPGHPRKLYPAGATLRWLLRTERLHPATLEPQTPRVGGPAASGKNNARSRRITAPYLPDLDPAKAAERRALIDRALHEPGAFWSDADLMLVADVSDQTVRAWTQGRRGSGFPAGGTAHDMILWLVRSERLFPGTWQVLHVPTGHMPAPERDAARSREPQMPAQIARALDAALGLKRGQGEGGDFIVRSWPDDDGIRHYQILPTGPDVAARILAGAADVEQALAAAGHPARVTRYHDWDDPDAEEDTFCLACGATVDFEDGRVVVATRDGNVVEVPAGGQLPTCTAASAPLDVDLLPAGQVPAAA